MASNLKLLLIENVEDLGIVGDVVSVRTGYARNFLLPRNLATAPDDNLMKKLAGKRADAEKMVASHRADREKTNDKLKGVEVGITRSCNDMGILYGAVTQQDIAKAILDAGYKVAPRDVRLSQTIKRIDTYDIHVKLANDLDAIVKVKVVPDREIKTDRETGGGAGAAENQGPAGAGDDKGRRRDAVSQALEAAAKETAEKGTGWAKKADPSASGSAPGVKSEGKGGKKGDKADKVGKGDKKPESHAEPLKDDEQGDKKSTPKESKKKEDKPAKGEKKK